MVDFMAFLKALGVAFIVSTSVASDIKAGALSRPNIVMIMTDDQDVRLNSLDFQPAVRNHFTEKGTSFVKHYCTVAQCCPSRVSLLTGKAAHNTNVTDVIAPYGGYGKFVEQGLNGQWLPSWFQQNGYNTYYTGKLMNNHSVVNYNKPFPEGFTATDFLVDPGTYLYYNTTMQSNRDVPRNLPGRYSTDVVAEKAIDFMKMGKDSGKPFFLTVAPIGPHGQTLFPFTAQNPSKFPIFGPPVPADRHKNLFSNVGIPRQVSFNKLVTGSAPSYLKDLPEWNQTVIDYYDEYYRLRLASLAAVDDLVTSVMDLAKNIGLLNNTYFIYTSDNGYHIGQHRLPAGKSCGYEEDINVPFIIRGPGIAKNSVYNAPTSHTDIAPTLFSLAGISLRNDFDGQTMPLFNGTKSSKHHHHHPPFPDAMKQEHINVEFWGAQLPEGRFGRDLVGTAVGSNNTYKAVRLISEAYDYYYAVWCTGDRELYNMKIDKYQTSNLAISDFVMEKSTQSTESTTSNDDYGYVQARLDTLLVVLKTCKGETCRNPWKVIHPRGDVQSMSDAMKSRYDKCYDKQPRVTFSKCAPGYLQKFEGLDSSSIKQC